MEILVGHLTWVMLLQRSALSVLSSVYAFAQAGKGRVLDLWPSVRQELTTAMGLLPLLVVHADA
eukprot:8401390-Pyramimonas_sp.AAC.1